MICKKLLNKFVNLTVLPIVIFSLLTSSLAMASSSAELNEIKKKQQKNSQIIEESKKKEQTVSGQMKNIDRKISSVQSQIDALSSVLNETVNKRRAKEEEIAKTSSSLEITQRQLQEATREVNHDQKILRKRVKNFYRNGNVSYIEVLLNSKSFVDFLTRVAYLQMIVRQDTTLLVNMKKTQALVREQKDKLERERQLISEAKAELVVQEQRIGSIKKSQETVKASQKKELSEKEKLFAEIKKNRQKAEELSKQLERDEANVLALIQSQPNKGQQTGGSGIVGTGQLRWPVRGRITSNFGYRIHPIFGTKRFHGGIDIAAPNGTPIAAADSGTVIYAGWRGGYGKAVIINHGNGMTTLYAHSSAILVSVGQSVSAGDIIAKVGSTGYSTGNHLHLEVMANGARKNPLIYL